MREHPYNKFDIKRNTYCISNKTNINYGKFKKCFGCKENKLLDFFYKKKGGKFGRQSRCIICVKIYNKKVYNENIKKYTKRNKEYREKNKEKYKKLQHKYYLQNQDSRKKYARDKRANIKEKVQKGVINLPTIKKKICSKCKLDKDISNFYFRKNRNVYHSACKYCENYEKRNMSYEKREHVNFVRRQTPYKPLTKEQSLLTNLRKRVGNAVKNNSKSDSTLSLLDCNISFLKKWFIFNFEYEGEDFNLENYGKIWEIDHIIPCDSFDMSDKKQQQQCFHWTNLRPMTPTNNRSKGNKIILPIILVQEIRLKKFIKINNISNDVLSLWKNGALTTAVNRKLLMQQQV